MSDQLRDRDWIDDLPGIRHVSDVTFGELMVPISAIREHFAALHVTDTGEYDDIVQASNGGPDFTPMDKQPDPLRHEDDGEGGCLVCREWTGADDVFNRIPFPCPTVRLAKP